MPSIRDMFISIRLINYASAELNRINKELGAVKKRTETLRDTAQSLAVGGALMMGAGAAVAAPIYKASEAWMEMDGVMHHMMTTINDGAESIKHSNEAMAMAEEIANYHEVTMANVADAYYIA